MSTPASPAAGGVRDARLDALKGAAIVCVVIYHTLGQYFVTAPTLALYGREFVFSFMLPLFAFLSGYVQPRFGALKPRPERHRCHLRGAAPGATGGRRDRRSSR